MGELNRLGRQLKRAGIEDILAVDGWRERGYDDFDPAWVCFHHTASSRRSGNLPSLGICAHGREGIPGPLCNILIGRRGTVALIAGGKANHAGLGGPLRGIPRDSANRYGVGIEVENDGVGEPWPREQLQVVDLVTAVLLDRFDKGPGHAFGHKEWAPDRKIDPARLDMDRYRQRVRKQLRELHRAA